MKINIIAVCLRQAVVTALIVLSANMLRAETRRAPTAYNAYDGLLPGARALSMGYAFTSVADDPAAIYFNPAGLATLTKGYISMSVEASRLGDIPKEQMFSDDPVKNSGFLLLALISGKGSFSFRPLSDMTIREANGNDWSNSEIKINAYTFSASHKNESGILTGLNITYLSGRISQAKIENNVPSSNLSDGYGFSMDMGFLYQISKEVGFGINFRNLLGTMWWDDFEKEQLPFCLQGGFSFAIPGYTIFAAEMERRYYRDEKPGPDDTIAHFGLEQTLSKALKARFGAFGPDFNDKEKTRMTYGIGYEINNYNLSLAAELYRINADDIYRYVFSFDIPI